ncbi:AIR synthase family protein [Clostridium sp. D2Q-11]|uniref:AIR synthase family protein n=1 Tax=Anaeromonas frigoriresistens TaxID=2683708 RepID=A0A942UYM8_9FIRM|nr:AIR synthase family protein [Anaeromonas frigoriresistens]MBS4538017.1 AIR synthase family protein [Anaeromonas frigoriresistens]
MDIGKLPNDLLKSLVFDLLTNRREDVLSRGGVGEDCAVIDFGDYGCVVSTDPITGASKNIGKLAVHISCNDVASNGAEPVGVLLSILAPEKTTKEDIKKIMKDASDTAKELNVEIIGGHTEITDSVNKIIINSTVIGKQMKDKILKPQNIKEGFKVILTKRIAIEGTSIIAEDLEDKLIKNLSKDILEAGKKLVDNISVVKEGMIAGDLGVEYMHDITEGGIFGAIYEASEAISKGIQIYEEKIKIDESTKEICKFLDINPYKLIASGSLIIITDENKANILLDKLNSENIEASIIGEVIDDGVYIDKEKISPPESDELYKVI